jgi:hypothetical protein
MKSGRSPAGVDCPTAMVSCRSLAPARRNVLCSRQLHGSTAVPHLQFYTSPQSNSVPPMPLDIYAPPTRMLFTGMWTVRVEDVSGRFLPLTHPPSFLKRMCRGRKYSLSFTMYPMTPMIKKPIPTACEMRRNSRRSATFAEYVSESLSQVMKMPPFRDHCGSVSKGSKETYACCNGSRIHGRP